MDNKSNIYNYKLDNGLEIIYKRDENFPIIATRVLTAAGEIYSPENLKGLSNLVNSLLQEGSNNYDANAISENIDKIGASLNSISDEEYSGYQIISLEEYFEKATKMLSEIMLNPSFKEEEIELYRNKKLDIITHQETQADFIMRKNLKKYLYKNHPYSYYQIEEEVLNEITRKDITNFYDEHYNPNESIIIAIGSIDFDKYKMMIEKYFSSWNHKERLSSSVIKVEDIKNREIYTYNRMDSSQAVIGIATKAVQINDKDYLAFKLANRIIGGPVIGRLFQRLREELGFTYGAYGSLIYNLNGASWSASTSVNKDKMLETVKEIDIIINDLKNKLVSDKEINDAKRSIIGEFELSFENSETELQHLLYKKLYSLNDDYFDNYSDKINELTKESVMDIFSRYIKLDNSVMVIVSAFNNEEEYSELAKLASLTKLN